MATRQPTLLGIPYDASSSYLRGAAGGPAKIREALRSPSSNGWSEAGRSLQRVGPGRELEQRVPLAVQAHVAAFRIVRDEGVSAIIVEQHAEKVLHIIDDALILDRGRVAHRAASGALLADEGTLHRYLTVSA